MSKELSQLDKDLISILKNITTDKQSITGVLLLCKDEAKETLIRYLLFKDKYATISDALCYTWLANGDRYQYLPTNMFVKYIGKTNDELTTGYCHQVGAVYGLYEDVYLIINTKKEEKEYPANRFVLMREADVTYTGIPNGDDSFETREGLKIGKEYAVKKVNGIKLTLDNGITVDSFETEPIDFVTAKPKKLKQLKFANALAHVRHALEFGNLRALSKRLNDKSELYSEHKDKTIVGAFAICDYLESIAKAMAKEYVFIDCAYSTVVDGEEMSGHTAGEKFIVGFYDDGTRCAVFIKTDKYYITRIEIRFSLPPYVLDEDNVVRGVRIEG